MCHLWWSRLCYFVQSADPPMLRNQSLKHVVLILSKSWPMTRVAFLLKPQCSTPIFFILKVHWYFLNNSTVLQCTKFIKYQAGLVALSANFEHRFESVMYFFFLLHGTLLIRSWYRCSSDIYTSPYCISQNLFLYFKVILQMAFGAVRLKLPQDITWITKIASPIPDHLKGQWKNNNFLFTYLWLVMDFMIGQHEFSSHIDHRSPEQICQIAIKPWLRTDPGNDV